MEKNKGLYMVIVVVVILLVGIWFWNSNKNNGATVGTNTGTQLPSTEDAGPGSVHKAPVLSYADALAKYSSSRIQLDANCQAKPSNVTFKNGSDLMVDNRSPKDRVIKVGSPLNIKAWGFKIVKLSSSTLPATWLVDCDSSQNVATILIQK